MVGCGDARIPARETCWGGRAYMAGVFNASMHVTRCWSEQRTYTIKVSGTYSIHVLCSSTPSLTMIVTRSQADYTPPASPSKGSALAAYSRIPYSYDNDVHMQTVKTLKDFKMQAPHAGFLSGLPISSDNTLNDIRMDTARVGGTTAKGGLKFWELELVDSPEVKRKATVAQLCTRSITCYDIEISTFFLRLSRLLLPDVRLPCRPERSSC